MSFSLDYEIALIPPIIVDKGTVEFSCEDVSLNSVWSIKLNETKLFFDVIMSHVLVQINPEKFNFKMNSYADIIIFLNK